MRRARTRVWRGWFAGVVCAGAVGVLAAGALGRPGVVRTKDGGAFRGDIGETPGAVTVKIRNIPTTLPREQVASITYDDDFEKGIEASLAKLGPEDVEGRIKLAREAYDAGDYELTRGILRVILDKNPNNAEAYDLYSLAGAEEMLARRREAEQAKPRGEEAGRATTTAARAGEGGGAGALGPGKLLSAGDINVIREGEITERDVNVRINFANNVQTRFAVSQGLDPRVFRMRSPLAQFLEIRKLGTPDMMGDMRVLSDPVVMMEFKRSVQPAVLSGCAAAGCHSAINPKSDFALYPLQDDAASYTNFYIMTTYTRTPAAGQAAGAGRGGSADSGGRQAGGPGVFGNAGAEQRMVDRSEPELSLVLQFGLPGGVAKYDHPLVKGMPVRAIYRGVNDMKYQAVLGWVMGLNPVSPGYSFDIKLPGMEKGAGATTVPGATTAPAGGAGGGVFR